LLYYSKINDTKACMDLLESSRGQLKADVNTKETIGGWTPLHFACLNGNAKLVNIYLFHEAIVDSETSSKLTPLIVAAQKYYFFLQIWLKFFRRGYEELAMTLLNAGADINFTDSLNNTALHYSSMHGIAFFQLFSQFFWFF